MRRPVLLYRPALSYCQYIVYRGKWSQAIVSRNMSFSCHSARSRALPDVICALLREGRRTNRKAGWAENKRPHHRIWRWGQM